MGLTEQELRGHPAVGAARASEPRFALVHIADRVRQRRRRLTLVASSGLAIILAAAVVVPLTLGNGRPLAGDGVSSAPAPPPREHFTVTVNGERSHLPGRAFAVRPGEKLTIEIDVSVPKNNTITSLWLGISTGEYGFSRAHGTYGNAGLTPVGIRPLLLRVRRPLTAGLHTLTFRWTAPEHPGQREIPLAAAWTFTAKGPPYEGSVAGAIAQFAMSRPQLATESPSPRR